MENDSYSFEGAFRLAAKVEDYWHRRGHHNVKAEPFSIGHFQFMPHTHTKAQERFGVRSNLVNGLPPHGDD